MKIKEIGYDEFIEKYKPIKNYINKEAPFDGFMFETFGRELNELKKYNVKNIWTIIDACEGLAIINGYHFVNRFGYFITENEWEEEHIDVDLELDVD